MLIRGLSNAKDKTGRTALAEYTNEGQFIATLWLPTDADPRGAVIEKVADAYGYDARVLPRKNAMLTTSFTGWTNYMRNLGEVLEDPEAMKRFGHTVSRLELSCPPAEEGLPRTGRSARGPLRAGARRHNYAFTTTALTSKIWLIDQHALGDWQAKAVADIGDPKKTPLPVDISLSADDRTPLGRLLHGRHGPRVRRDGPVHAEAVDEKKIGRQLNMVSQSWDGKRLYFTSSLISSWDKQGADNEQFLKAYNWDGTVLPDRFALDFNQLRLGRPHLMPFGSAALDK